MLISAVVSVDAAAVVVVACTVEPPPAVASGAAVAEAVLASPVAYASLTKAKLVSAITYYSHRRFALMPRSKSIET